MRHALIAACLMLSACSGSPVNEAPPAVQAETAGSIFEGYLIPILFLGTVLVVAD